MDLLTLHHAAKEPLEYAIFAILDSIPNLRDTGSLEIALVDGFRLWRNGGVQTCHHLREGPS